MDPQIHAAEAAMIIALVFLHRSNESIAWINQALARHPTYPSTLRFATVAYAAMNRVEEARLMFSRLLKIDADMRLSHLKEWLPFRRQEDVAMYIAGMRKSGMPE
jgi:tetratricopeptide (TPR) repeat protein